MKDMIRCDVPVSSCLISNKHSTTSKRWMKYLYKLITALSNMHLCQIATSCSFLYIPSTLHETFISKITTTRFSGKWDPCIWMSIKNNSMQNKGIQQNLCYVLLFWRKLCISAYLYLQDMRKENVDEIMSVCCIVCTFNDI